MTSKIQFLLLCALIILAACQVINPSTQNSENTAPIMVSTDAAGNAETGASQMPVMSPDKNKVLFISNSKNLVPSDTNGTEDIFLKDLHTGSITRINTDASGKEAVGENFYDQKPVFSPDGSKIAFFSMASNLVPDDTNQNGDLFIKDIASGAIVRINTNATGQQADDCNGRLAGLHPSFSPDGKLVTFISACTNLTPDYTGLKSGYRSSKYTKNLETGEISWVSDNKMGNLINDVSGSPLFSSVSGITAQIASASPHAFFSSDGSKLLFIGDPASVGLYGTGRPNEIMMYDLADKSVKCISEDIPLKDGGTFSNFVISTDNQYIAVDQTGVGDVIIKKLSNDKMIHIKNAHDPSFLKGENKILYEGLGHIFIKSFRVD